ATRRMSSARRPDRRAAAATRSRVRAYRSASVGSAVASTGSERPSCTPSPGVTCSFIGPPASSGLASHLPPSKRRRARPGERSENDRQGEAFAAPSAYPAARRSGRVSDRRSAPVRRYNSGLPPPSHRSPTMSDALTPRDTPLREGQPPPDFTLKDHKKNDRTQSAPLAKSDVVLCLFPTP